MYLPRDDQQYGHIPIAGVPDGDIPLVKVGDHDWALLEADTEKGVGWWRVLLRGPDYTDDTDGIPVSDDRTPVVVRVKDAPESVSEGAGTIYLRDV